MNQKLKITLSFCLLSFTWAQDCCEAADIATYNCGGLGCYIPQCTENCEWDSMQCWDSTGYCWCVDENGIEIEGTSTPSWEGTPDCEEPFEECFDFTGIDFGECTMVLGIGLINDECNYISGCDWIIDGIDYSDLFFNSIEDCEEICGNNGECYFTTDDIMGPYFFEGAPLRTVIAHSDEPGQRLFISGKILQNDCESPISGAMLEVWHPNDAGCYSIVEDCPTGNPANDYYNLRGKMFSGINGQYNFETILPGYYEPRPRHIHIKITTSNEETLITQLYFEGDPYCETDFSCQNAEDRILILQEDTLGLHGEMEFIMNSISNGIILGDINFDTLVNVQDIILLVGIIMNDFDPTDFQIYSGDMNHDNEIDVLDIVQIVYIILNANILPQECYIIPEVGPCDGICPTYYYNQTSNECEEFITGCCGVEAFNTMQDCQNSCE